MSSQSIGEISRRTGINIETIRYYERIGITPKSDRNRSGHRRYDKQQLMRLTFIKRSRELGFSLKEVRALLGLADAETPSCAKVHDMTIVHLKDVKNKISDLRQMETVLENMAAECSKGDIPDCPIIDALFETSS